MNRMNPKVDGFIKTSKKWQEEFKKLRMILLACGLTEELKWGKPCYTLQKSNIVIIHEFKEYCALLFCKGALLKDANGLLIQQKENVRGGISRSVYGRSLGSWRFGGWIFGGAVDGREIDLCVIEICIVPSWRDLANHFQQSTTGGGVNADGTPTSDRSIHRSKCLRQ